MINICQFKLSNVPQDLDLYTQGNIPYNHTDLIKHVRLLKVDDIYCNAYTPWLEYASGGTIIVLNSIQHESNLQSCAWQLHGNVEITARRQHSNILMATLLAK